jgi:hypothetical protein
MFWIGVVASLITILVLGDAVASGGRTGGERLVATALAFTSAVFSIVATVSYW